MGDKLTTPFIYVLVDPREPRHFRYVGMTMNDATRPNDHRYWVKRTTNGKYRHVANWVRKLHREGVSYSWDIIEYCSIGSTKDFVYELEQNYIRVARLMGHKLTNATDGGPGILGYKFSLEQRARMSAGHKGKGIGPRSPEHCAAISAGLRGKPKSHGQRAAISDSLKGKSWSVARRVANKGKKLSPEHRAAIGIGQKGKPKSPEHCAAISDGKKGKPSSQKGKPWSVARRVAEDRRKGT